MNKFLAEYIEVLLIHAYNNSENAPSNYTKTEMSTQVT